VRVFGEAEGAGQLPPAMTPISDDNSKAACAAAAAFWPDGPNLFGQDFRPLLFVLVRGVSLISKHDEKMNGPQTIVGVRAPLC
jgi:hypothetical protein